METDEIERVIIQALNHDERRTILRIIRAQEKGSTYSEILGELGVPTGTLNYHLKQLGGLIERDNERRYHLTPLGERSLSVLLSMTTEMSEGLEDYLRSTRASQSRSVHPTVVGLLYLGIVFDCIFIAIWGYTGYANLISGGPSFVLALVVVLISLGLIMLYGLVRALKTAPAYVRNIEKKLGVT